MNKIERKKLILIIAIAVTAILTAIVVMLSMLTNNPNTPAPTPTSTVPSSSPGTAQGGNDNGAPISGTNEKGAPPADIYKNDYSKDTGYTKLPPGYDSKNAAGTVYDPKWAENKMNVLLCELSNKQTITVRALQPLNDFNTDLALVHTTASSTMSATINRYITIYEAHMGERADGNYRSELSNFCNPLTDEE